METAKLPLVYRVIKYGVEKEQFTKSKLFTDLNLTDQEQFYVDNVMTAQGSGVGLQTNHVLILINNSATGESREWQYRITPNAIFKYTDHLEIVEARESAQEAKRLSWYAIWISSCLAVIQIVIAYFQLR